MISNLPVQQQWDRERRTLGVLGRRERVVVVERRAAAAAHALCVHAAARRVREAKLGDDRSTRWFTSLSRSDIGQSI